MNTRQIPPGGGKPVAKPVSGKPLSSKPLRGKPRDQDKGMPRKTVAEATGAPKREEAMLAAASYVHAIASDSAPARHMLSAAFESIERSFRAAGFGTLAVNRKLIDIARANLSSGFDLAKDLAGANYRLINQWLDEAGQKMRDAKTWPQQARLADLAKKFGSEEDQRSYQAYKAWLKAAIEPDEYDTDKNYRRTQVLVWHGTAELTEKAYPEIFKAS